MVLIAPVAAMACGASGGSHANVAHPSPGAAAAAEAAELAGWQAADRVLLGGAPLARDERRALATELAPEDPLAGARALLRGEQPVVHGVPNSQAPSVIGGGPNPAIDDAAMRRIGRQP